MSLIDTHTHLFSEEFDDDIDEVIRRAKEAGVSAVLLPNIDVDSIDSLRRLVDSYPSFCYPMMGLHPCSITQNWKDDLSIIRKELSINKYYGIGEIGIDLYWSKEFEAEQISAFEEQLHLSLELQLPVSIHSRDSFSQVLRSVKRVSFDKLRGSFHSFCGNSDELKQILDLPNFAVGINGIVTFKNSPLADVLSQDRSVIDRIVLETDAPYLSPVPNRGKRNESANLRFIAQKLSEVFGIPVSAVEERTTMNFYKYFGDFVK